MTPKFKLIVRTTDGYHRDSVEYTGDSAEDVERKYIEAPPLHRHGWRLETIQLWELKREGDPGVKLNWDE